MTSDKGQEDEEGKNPANSARDDACASAEPECEQSYNTFYKPYQFFNGISLHIVPLAVILT